MSLTDMVAIVGTCLYLGGISVAARRFFESGHEYQDSTHGWHRVIVTRDEALLFGLIWPLWVVPLYSARAVRGAWRLAVRFVFTENLDRRKMM